MFYEQQIISNVSNFFFFPPLPFNLIFFLDKDVTVAITVYPNVVTCSVSQVDERFLLYN